MRNIKESVWAYYDTNKITVLSVALSIGVHLAVVVAIKYTKFEQTIAAVPETYVDLGYQEFEEVPQVVQDVKQVDVKPDVDPVQNDPTPVAAQEMQDSSSDVAGLQKEAPKEAPKTTVVNNGNVTDVPYYKVKPKYPKEALAQGIEGHVLLQIDVLTDGSVENLKVLSGEKLNVFESEARRAVAKYKYKPFVDETGAVIVKHNHLVRVEFKINEVANN